MFLSAITSLIFVVLDLVGVLFNALFINTTGIGNAVLEIVTMPFKIASYMIVLAPYSFAVVSQWIFINFVIIVTIFALDVTISFIPRFRRSVG